MEKSSGKEGNQENEVIMEWLNIPGKRCVKFTFINEFSFELAQRTIKHWNDEFVARVSPDEKIIVICNCLRMQEYNGDARNLWQNNLVSQKKNIEQTWIVSNNKLINTAAKTMGLLAGFKVSTVKNESEIEF